MCRRKNDMNNQIGSQEDESPAQLIDARIEELDDWRGKTLEKVRRLIKEADPEIVEEWKWRKPSSPGTPVWSHSGGICTGETYKNVVKLTFFRGAALRARSGAPSTSMKVTRSTNLPSRPLFKRPWP
jgi:hypothetical protein